MRQSRAGKTCAAEECGATVWARGMCRKHYARWHNHGHPTEPTSRERYQAQDRSGQELTQAYLHQRLLYDPETGAFTFKSIGYPQRDRVFAGKQAGKLTKAGYISIHLRIGGRSRFFVAHRLAWLHVYGELPQSDLDHINRDRSDNRIANLRLATKSQNSGNRDSGRRRSSPFKGVAYVKSNGRWQASCRGKYLGQFDTPEDAARAYDSAAAASFGEFALTNTDLGLL